MLVAMVGFGQVCVVYKAGSDMKNTNNGHLLGKQEYQLSSRATGSDAAVTRIVRELESKVSEEATTAEKTTKQKAIKCRVVSDKMNKSRVGLHERLVKHPVYGKYIRKSTKYMFHDEENKTSLM